MTITTILNKYSSYNFAVHGKEELKPPLQLIPVHWLRLFRWQILRLISERSDPSLRLPFQTTIVK